MHLFKYAVAALALVWMASTHAQVAFAPRFSTNAKGNISFVSNTSMTCPIASGGCGAAQTTTLAAGSNNNFAMVYVDIDADTATFNSSSAQLNLTAGSSILWAGLYWAGDSASTSRGTVQIKGPNETTYSPRTATQVNAIANTYQGFVDITSFVSAQGNGNYTLANVQSTLGANRYAGWTIVVAYQNASLPTRNIAVYDGYQRVNSGTAGGGVNVSLSGFLTPPIGPVNTSIGTIGYDGDRGASEGTAGLQFGQTATTLSPVFNALNPQTDYFNSTISRDGAEVLTRNPAHRNTFGYDADISKPNTPLPNGATTAVVRVSSSSETIDLGVVTLVNDIFVPNIKDTLIKKVTDINGGQVLPGDILEYELTFGNTGQDPALEVILRDKIPANTTYVAGSVQIVSGANAGAKTDAAADDQAEFDVANNQIVVRAGVGANAATGGKVTPGDPNTVIRFRVKINNGVPGDTIIDNFGVVTFKAQTLGTVSSDTSDADASEPGDQPARVVVASPDLTITKAHFGNFFAGQSAVTYSLVVTNSGLASTSGVVTVTDVPPTGLSAVSAAGGAGWACVGLVCTNSNVLAPGQSYAPIIVTANVDLSAPASITNVANVAGGSEGASKTGNNSASDPTTIIQGFPVSKSFTPTSVSTGQTSQLRITVSNLSSGSAVNGLSVNDPLPAGLLVANPAAASTLGCGALSFAPAAGAATLNSTGGTIAASSSCTLIVNVVAANAGAYANSIPAGSITTANAGNSKAPAEATLSVAAPDLQISKAASGSFFRSQASGASFAINVSNTGSGTTTGAVTVVDNLPAGLVPLSATGTGWNCSVAGQQITCSRADGLAANGAYPLITIAVSVDANAPTTLVNTASVTGGGEPAANAGNNSASAAVAVLVPATVSKSFAPSVISLGGTSLLQITINNSNSQAITGLGVIDNYPANLLNAASPNAASTCAGGTLVANANGGSVQLSGATLAANQSCIVSVVVTPSAAGGVGGYANQLPVGAVTSSNAGSSTQAASATLNVSAPDLTISKTHTGAFFPGQTTASFAIVVANNGPSGNGATLGQITMTDTLPAALVPTAATGAGWGPGPGACSIAGQVVTCNRSDALAFGSSFPAILVTVNVTDAASGTVTNIANVSGGSEPSSNAGNNSASDAVFVLSRPTIVKSFSPSVAAIGAPVQMTVVISNPNPLAITGVGFSDTYPAGLANTISPAPSSTCGGNPAAATSGASLIISNATVAANSVCTVTVNVQANAAGDLINAIPAGALVSANAGSNNVAANATLKSAGADLVLSKTHVGNFFQGQTTAVFVITVTNQGAGATLGTLQVKDNVPAGLTPVSAGGANWGPQAGNQCTVAGQSVTCETSNVLAAGASLSFRLTVSVALNAPNSLTNLAQVVGGNEPLSAQNNNAASDTVLIYSSPRASKTFSPAAASAGQTVTLTVTLFNDNPGALLGLAFSDNLPAGMVTAGAATNTCAGTVNVTSSALSLSGGSVPAIGSCQISIPVVAAAPGSYVNTIPAGAVSSNEAGSSQQNAQATLAVAAADLQIAKSHSGNFFQGQSPVTYTLVVSNTGAGNTDGSSVIVTDDLPVGMTPINATGSGWACGFSGQTITCSRSGVFVAGATSSITVVASVDANAPASVVNAASVSGGGEPASSSANNSVSDPTTILANPVVSKAFLPTTVNINQPSVMTIRISNPNALVMTGLAFNDLYPSGLVNAPVLALTNTCGGTPATTANSVSLASGSIAPNGSCEVSVQVQAAASGGYTNSLSSGSVTTANAGSNAQAAQATLNVAGPDFSISKSHTGNFFKNQIGAQFVISVRNIGLGATSGQVTVNDTLPGTMVATAIGGTGWTCGLSPLQCTRSDSLPAGSVYPDIIVTVNVSDSAAPAESNRADVSGGGESASNLANNVATDSVQILGNPSITKSFTPASINANNPSDLVITLTNPNAVAITSVSVTDNLPSGISTTAAATGTCGGSLITNVGSVALSGATIPANGSCQIKVQVTGSTPGGYANVIPSGALTSANAGSNQQTATANLSIAAPDLIVAKTHAGDFYVGQNPAAYTLEVRNIGAGATNGSPILMTDTLPAGLSYQNFSGSGWACTVSGQTISCSNSTVVAVGGALPVLTINVAVLAAAAPGVANTASVGGGGEPAANAGNNSVTDNTKVLRNPGVSKAFTPSSGNINVPTRVVITLSNSNDVAITGAAFTDTYQGGMLTANPANALSTCGGTVAAAPGGNSLQLTGGTIPPNGNCLVEVNVVVSSAGNYTNTLAAGAVSSTNAGTNSVATTAFFAAQSPDLATVKLHGLSFFQGQTGGTFTLKITNVGVSASTGLVTVTDAVPAGMTLMSMSGTGWACSGNACTRNDGLAAGASYDEILVTVNIASSAGNSLVNVANVSNANEPAANLANNVTQDTVQIYANPTAAKSFSPPVMFAGDVSVLRIVLGNTNPVAANGAAFTDTMPAAIQVATPANAVSTCGGAVAAAGNVISLSGGAIPANGNCEVRVNITATLPGVQLNTIAAGALSTSNTGSNQTATSATLTVASPDLILSKSHSGNFFQGQNGVTFTLVVTNIGLDASSGPISVTDTFPAGLTPVSASGTGWSCSVAGQVVSCTNPSVAGSGSALSAITLVANVAPSAVSVTNTAVVGGGGEAASLAANNTAQDPVIVLTPIQVSKSFLPNPIVNGQITNLVISLSNLNAIGGSIPVSLTDTMPPQITIAGVATANCPVSSLVAVTGSFVLQVNTATLAPLQTCLITVPVTASAPGAWQNTINPTDVTPNTNAPAIANLVVNAPNLSISKSHTGTFFAGQQGASFAVIVANVGNAATSGSTVAVTDTLPAGLTPVSASGAGWTCAPPAGQQISCSRTGVPSAVLAASASFATITVLVNVDANASGNLVNSAQVSGGGDVDTTNNTATDSVLVLRHLSITKQFGSSAIGPGQTTTLTVRLINSNPVAVTGVGFTDTFPNTPGPMVVSGAIATSCPVGFAQALAGNGGIVLSGATVAANSSCTVTAIVTAATSGLYNNIIAANNLVSDNAGSAAQDAQDSITVEAPDLIVKKTAVNAPYYPGQTNAVFSIVVQNIGNATATTGIITVLDNLPTGLQPTAVSGTGWACSLAGASATCTRDAAAANLVLGASYPAISITATVALSANGTLSNTAAISGGGDNNPANNSGRVNFEILRSPSVSKSFAPSSAQISQTVQLTIALTNPNSIALSGAAVTDTLPTGVQLSADPAPVSTCGGVVAALANGNVVTLSGGAIPSAGCFIRVNVIAANPGTFVNLIPAGQLLTANGGASQQAATASLQISAPDLKITKKSTGAFWRGQISGAAYVISVSNIGSAPTNGTVTVQDTIPSGLSVGTVTAVGWTCAVAGQVVSCARADALPVGDNYADIQISVTVARDAPLSLVNTARISGGGESPSALANNSADAITTILANPVVAKKFSPASMSLGQVATLEITVQNSNAVAITNVAVVDAYPAGLINAPVPNASASCGGTLLAAAGTSSISLGSATIASNGSCVIKVDVTTAVGAVPTTFVNTILAGSVTSANAGDNPVGAGASLSVASADLVVVKRHVGDFYQGQTNGTYTLAVTNQGSGNSLGRVSITDTLPSNMTATAAAGNGWACSAVPAASITCTRSDVLTAGSSWPLIEITVQVSRNASSTVNFANLTGGGENAAAATNNGASDPTTILANPTISKAFSASSAPINTPLTLTLVLRNSNTVNVTGAAVIDTFPAGLAMAAAPNAQNTCGGTVSTAGNVLGLTGGSIPANGNCTVAVSVIVSTTSAVVNTLPPGALNSVNAGNNQQTATASITGFVTEPTGYKSVRLANDADSSGGVSAGDTLEWTLIYANTQNGAVQRPGFQINDSLPAGLTLTAAPTIVTTGAGTVATGNASYNGAAASALLSIGAVLDVGGVITVRIPVRILPNVEGTLSNQATATAPSLTAPIRSDAIDNTTPQSSLPPGVVVPSGSLPVTQTTGLDATLIRVNIPARIGVAKAVNSVQQINGTTIRVVYDVLVKNFGTQAAPNVQAVDSLLLTYPAPVSFSVVTAPFVVSGTPLATNASFNGNGDIRLLQGNAPLAADATTLIRFAVNVTLSGSQSNFSNSVFASTAGAGPNPGGNVALPSVPGGLPVFTPPVGAISTDASNGASQGATPAQLEAAVDPSGNGRPSDLGEDNPTLVNLAYAAALRGSVWFDTTTNRSRDPGEAGVANFGVELINTATNQTIACVAGVNSAIGCITMPDGRSLFATNASGNYEVIGVPVGNYLVQFRDGTNNIIYGTPVNGTSNPQSSVAPSRDGLRVALGAGDAVLDQSLPLDPSGVVYNSSPTSRAPIPGAVVTFCGPATFVAATQLVGGASYTPVPGKPNCAAMTVGALGFYQFLLQPGAPAGQYTLTATAPSFFGPSVVIPPTGTPPALPPAPGVFAVQPQVVPPTGAQATTYYLVLNLSPGVQDVVHNHIPLDPLGNARLFVTKTVNQRTAEIGDSVEYTISVLSPDTTVNNVNVTDRLPTGFRLIPRTVRINGVSVSDPVGAPGPQMTFNAGMVAQNVATKISYRVRLGVGSQIGDGINRASASATGGINSNVAQAVVKVTGGVFTSDGCVVGKIFVDCNRNHTQDAGEPGIPGVRLYLEDGTYLISDRDGKYSYCGLTNSTHVIKVDPRTLPEGSRLTTFSNRNVGDAGSVLIDMRSGELHRADFVEGSCSPEILDEVEKRRGRATPLSGSPTGLTTPGDVNNSTQGGTK